MFCKAWKIRVPMSSSVWPQYIKMILRNLLFQAWQTTSTYQIASERASEKWQLNLIQRPISRREVRLGTHRPSDIQLAREPLYRSFIISNKTNNFIGSYRSSASRNWKNYWYRWWLIQKLYKRKWSEQTGGEQTFMPGCDENANVTYLPLPSWQLQMKNWNCVR